MSAGCAHAAGRPRAFRCPALGGHRRGPLAGLGVALGLGLALDAGAATQPELLGHELRLAPSAVTVPVGVRGAVSLTVVAREGFRIDGDGPLRVRLEVAPEPGLLIPRRRFERRDAADARADAPRFDLAYRADRPGNYRLTVDVLFWVCRRHSCWPVRERRNVAIAVQRPGPDGDARAGATASD